MPTDQMPVWVCGDAHDGEPIVRFRMEGQLPEHGRHALLHVLSSGPYRIWVNGRPVAACSDPRAEQWNVDGMVRTGRNTVQVDVLAQRQTAPENAWAVLELPLPQPTSIDRVEFVVSQAQGDEWLYLQAVDADGGVSGFVCPETGRSDLRLGQDGNTREIGWSPGREPELQRPARFQPERVVLLRFRIDQKHTRSTPEGELRIGSLRINGKPFLPGAQSWAIRSGHGPLHAWSLTPDSEGVQVAYRFTGIAPRAYVLLELSTSNNGELAGQIVTDSRSTTVFGRPAGLEEPAPVDDMAMYAARRPRDLRTPGLPPITACLLANTPGQTDILQANQPWMLHVTGWSCTLTVDRTLWLEMHDWSGRRVWRSHSSAQPGAGLPRWSVSIPAQPMGAYRLTLRWRGAETATLGYALLDDPKGPLSAVCARLGPFRRPVRRMGVNLNSASLMQPAVWWALREMGAELLVVHLMPSELHTDTLETLLQFCRATRCRFAINNEAANWMPEALDPTGSNTFNAPNGCHRWDLDARTLRRCADTGLFEGVVYDESEHMQMCRNAYSGLPDRERRKPHMVETTGLSLDRAYAAYLAAVRQVVAYNRTHGSQVIVESVFPSLWHPLARAGSVLCPKLLKESVYPVVLAEGLGASRQYGAALWFSPDLWWLADFGGHSARELTHALRMAWQAGVDTVYVEFLTMLMWRQGALYRFNAPGHALLEHVHQWLPRQQRRANRTRFQPEVALIHFPAGDWGQASCGYWNMLYGALDLPSTPATREHLQVWAWITGHAELAQAVNANSPAIHGAGRAGAWRGVYPSPSVAAYDHLVGPEPLEGCRLLVVCGPYLSAEAQRAITQRVRDGATCIISTRLAPAGLQDPGAALPYTRQDGAGRWVLTDRFDAATLAPWTPLLNRPRTGMAIRFGDTRRIIDSL